MAAHLSKPPRRNALVDGFPIMGAPNAGDTAWMLASAALVLLMTPGLAFFYGGMVR
ncbi:ammonium transporter [Mycobacteroides franklinii]|uniref:Ammonium transporter n=1 Tax=Mycobacteroides franklinii TaxID=948102 RepID=A0A4V3A6L4_9MYCO|nr:ammonium transporter [Mycobacteroides franklinii]